MHTHVDHLAINYDGPVGSLVVALDEQLARADIREAETLEVVVVVVVAAEVAEES